MSSAADVIARADALLVSLGALIGSARDIDLPAALAELGFAGTAAELSDELAELMLRVHDGLAMVTTLGQLGALFGMMEPLVEGLRGIFVDGGRLVSSLGLESALVVSDAIAGGFERVEGMLELVGSQTLVVEQAEVLRGTTQGLVGELSALASDFRTAEASS